MFGHLQLIDRAAGASEIKNTAVEAQCRGQGVGRALIGAAIERTRGRGRSALVVGTAAGDVGSLRFYQRVGLRMRSTARDALPPTPRPATRKAR